jgi:hypothetical protein
MDRNFPWIEYDFSTIAQNYVRNYALDDSYPIITDNQIFFLNDTPQRYLITLPILYSLSENDQLEMIWSTVQLNKKVILVEAKKRLSLAIIPYH